MASSARLQQIRNHIGSSDLLASNPTRLDGQVVLITGAAQGPKSFFDPKNDAYWEIGIGRATAEMLARQGAKIAINEAFYLAGDMLDRTFPVKLVEAVLTKFGKINCLINNAGQSSSFAYL
jgi:3-oxoacyl-[acyl-carrier protein] reductase